MIEPPYPSVHAPAPSHGTIAASEGQLRADLAHGDTVMASFSPILRHLMANDDHSVFADEVIARIRGMQHHIAVQLANLGRNGEQTEQAHGLIDALTTSLIDIPGFMEHLHGLALEWQLTEKLRVRLALDPVLPPLIQSLIASPDHTTAGNAMNLLTAQARFCQHQQRMQLPLAELPGDLLHRSLLALRAHGSAQTEGDFDALEAGFRATFDEGRSRLGLIARIVAGMGGGAVAALSLSHAGVAMFLSVLAMASGQSRNATVFATNQGQMTRLAVALRAGGLKPTAVAEQLLAIHPECPQPQGIEMISADQAALMLSGAALYRGQ